MNQMHVLSHYSANITSYYPASTASSLQTWAENPQWKMGKNIYRIKIVLSGSNSQQEI